MMNDAHDTRHQVTLARITAHRGKLYAGIADRFAQQQGDLQLVHYDPVTNALQLTDGEVYTLQRAVIEVASRLPWSFETFGGGTE